MRFSVLFLVALLAASAIQMLLIWTHPVWALSLPTLLMLIFTLGKRLRRNTAHDGRLIWIGTAASFIWMMIFGGATFVVGYAYRSATNSWPDPDEVYIDTPTFFVIFTVMYGGGAAIVGFLAGCIAEFGSYLYHPHFKLPEGG